MSHNKKSPFKQGPPLVIAPEHLPDPYGGDQGYFPAGYGNQGQNITTPGGGAVAQQPAYGYEQSKGLFGGFSKFMGSAATPLGIAASLGSSVFGYLKARKEEKKAAKRLKKEEAKMKEMEDIYANLDTSNPYLNLENTMEDLTVNQQQAQFERQSFQQTQANIMGNLAGAAGGSGIANLAQSLAQQGQIAAQKQSADIGRQEAQNQMAERREAGNIQQLERKGEIMSREMKKEQTGTLLGMAQERTAAAAQQQAAAQEAKWGAITGGLTGAANMFAGFGDDSTITPGGIVGTQGYGTGGQAQQTNTSNQKYLNDGSLNPNYTGV